MRRVRSVVAVGGAARSRTVAPLRRGWWWAPAVALSWVACSRAPSPVAVIDAGPATAAATAPAALPPQPAAWKPWRLEARPIEPQGGQAVPPRETRDPEVAEFGMMGLGTSESPKVRFGIAGIDAAAHTAVLSNRERALELATFDTRDGGLLDVYRTELLSSSEGHPITRDAVDSPRLLEALREVEARLRRAAPAGVTDVVALSADGGRTAVALDHHAAPTGFGSGRSSRTEPDLYVRAGASALRHVASGHGPAFSPDGQWLAFYADRAVGLVNLTRPGGEVTLVETDAELLYGEPLAWSADGRFIFTAGRFRIGGKVTVTRGAIRATGHTIGCLLRVDVARHEVKRAWCDPTDYTFAFSEGAQWAFGLAFQNERRVSVTVALPEGKVVRRQSIPTEVGGERVSVDPTGRVALSHYRRGGDVALVLESHQPLPAFDDARWASADTLVLLQNGPVPSVLEVAVSPPSPTPKRR